MPSERTTARAEGGAITETWQFALEDVRNDRLPDEPAFAQYRAAIVRDGVSFRLTYFKVRQHPHRGPIMQPNLSTNRQIAITVSDVESAFGFYRDILGLSFLFSPGPDLAFLDAGGVRLMLSTPQGAGEVGKNSILYFTVFDIESVHASLVERGAANERVPALAARLPDHDLWTGFLGDPDGNLVGLIEEKK